MANMQVTSDSNPETRVLSRTSPINPDNCRSLHGEIIVDDIGCLWHSSRKSKPRPRTTRLADKTAFAVLECLGLATASSARNSSGSIRLPL